MKVLIGFPLEAQKVQEPDGLPRASCMIPVGAKVLHLGVAYPSDLICVFAVVDAPKPPVEGQPPQWGENLQRLEFVVCRPGMPVPSGDYLYRGPVRAKQTLEDKSVVEALIFLFEKKPVESRLIVPGGRG